jgi:hypothetical protein
MQYTSSVKHKTIVLVTLVLLGVAVACGGQAVGSSPTQVDPNATTDPALNQVATDIAALNDTLDNEPTAEAGNSQPLSGSCDDPFTPEESNEVALGVEPGVMEVRDTGFISVAGTIHNPTADWLGGTKVWVRVCNAQGQLLMVDYVFAKPSQIEPNGEAYFYFLQDVKDLSGSGAPTRFQVDASAVPGDDRGVRAELVNFTITPDSTDARKLIAKGEFHNTGTVACLSPEVAFVFTRNGQVVEIGGVDPQEISRIEAGASSPIDDFWYIPAGADSLAQTLPVCDPFSEN